MKNTRLVLSCGFALFSMFFGSGNLVFPILVGTESEGHYLLAALGILLSGVVVPFLGVLGMMLYEGEIDQFFHTFGKKGIFVFSLLALALMGPFGVLARCLTVAHGALQLLIPQASLVPSSLFLCVLIYLLASNKRKIVGLLGTLLTPLLLLALGAIAYFGIFQGKFPMAKEGAGFQAFGNGFLQGYQTMDLLAAFFFSQFVIRQLGQSLPQSKLQERVKVFFQAAFVGGFLLCSIYFVLVLLGNLYVSLLVGKAPQEMLGQIALEALGPFAALFLCLAVVFACLTTAIVLTSLSADFLENQVLKGRIRHSHALMSILFIAFIVSTLDFGGIAKFLGPLLELVYPALIALTVVNIASKFYRFNPSHWPFTLTFLAKLSQL